MAASAAARAALAVARCRPGVCPGPVRPSTQQSTSWAASASAITSRELCDCIGQIALEHLWPCEAQKRQYRDMNRSPMASARSRPSSAAALRCDWVTGDDRRRRPARRGSGSTAIGRRVPERGRSPRRSTAAPPRRCRPRCSRRRSGPGRSRAGSSSSRAIVRACSAWSMLSWRPRCVEHGLVGQRPRAQPRAPRRRDRCRRSRTASNHASPSRMRPRVSHSGCSDDASCSACSMSAFSRLHANAARRLSISISACSTRCSWPARAGVSSSGGHATCSGRGGGRGRRRPRRTRRASPARTGAPSPAAGIAFGPLVSSATTSDLSTSRRS